MEFRGPRVSNAGTFFKARARGQGGHPFGVPAGGISPLSRGEAANGQTILEMPPSSVQQTSQALRKEPR